MKYLMKLSNQYEIEADSEDEALEKLGDYLDSNNMTAETEFWESIDVILEEGQCECQEDGKGCNVPCPEDEDMTCSRSPNHEGKHFACTEIRHRLYEWED